MQVASLESLSPFGGHKIILFSCFLIKKLSFHGQHGS
ncbi:unnamed protein product [Acanthoscelides obtectus]|uniref:Uncharacterized protein n=1 Tax=Acanthoscelides obtectus TaxID=200917 RepID=A0A9P0JSW1_ACAOB|nr:unnamed protein product [Acanthoscelides obtectus]CAH2011672.1 unnamed protein product [Acanthoscelides obtectus]CAK1633612.1 hypothetical protein AOBTE_LOCUS8256 [Acanthoscelides obtectus]CAK1633862.1 hypothetical protein AOBTE_LOCUS8445 [Acanthoscelides obtectus]